MNRLAAGRSLLAGDFVFCGRGALTPLRPSASAEFRVWGFGFRVNKLQTRNSERQTAIGRRSRGEGTPPTFQSSPMSRFLWLTICLWFFLPLSRAADLPVLWAERL